MPQLLPFAMFRLQDLYPTCILHLTHMTTLTILELPHSFVASTIKLLEKTEMRQQDVGFQFPVL